MNFRPLLSGLISAVVVGVLIWWVSREVADLPRGQVRYGRRMRALSVVTLVGCLVFLLAAFHSSPSQRVVAIFLATSLFGGSIWLVLETFFVKATVSETHLTHTSPWRGTRTVPWSAIVDVKFSELSSCHVLATAGFGKVRLSIYMLGVDRVFERLQDAA